MSFCPFTFRKPQITTKIIKHVTAPRAILEKDDAAAADGKTRKPHHRNKDNGDKLRALFMVFYRLSKKIWR
jgi:hypothetical protein